MKGGLEVRRRISIVDQPTIADLWYTCEPGFQGDTTGNVAILANTIYARPIYVGQSVWQNIGVDQTSTAVGTMDLGIYTVGADGWPDVRLAHDSGNDLSAATGAVLIPLGPTRFPTPWVWALLLSSTVLNMARVAQPAVYARCGRASIGQDSARFFYMSRTYGDGLPADMSALVASPGFTQDVTSDIIRWSAEAN